MLPNNEALELHAYNLGLTQERVVSTPEGRQEMEVRSLPARVWLLSSNWKGCLPFNQGMKAKWWSQRIATPR